MAALLRVIFPLVVALMVVLPVTVTAPVWVMPGVPVIVVKLGASVFRLTEPLKEFPD